MAEFSAQKFGLALDRMSDQVKAEFLRVAQQAADAQVAEVLSQYPRGKTGNLRGGVRASRATKSFGYIARSTAPHTHLYELGHGPRKKQRLVWVPTAVRVRGRYAAIFESFLSRQREL